MQTYAYEERHKTTDYIKEMMETDTSEERKDGTPGEN